MKVHDGWHNYEDYTHPGERTRLLMSYVPQGGNWRNIPPEVAYFPPTTHSQKYYRLKWNEPSITITNFRKPNITHPEKDRTITVAEAAALMGLEEDFPIYGKSLDSRQQQVANGVTQSMARFIKEHVTKALEKFRMQGYVPVLG
jgi:DNA (cytosine-5)-methyltransferase 1